MIASMLGIDPEDLKNQVQGTVHEVIAKINSIDAKLERIEKKIDLLLTPEKEMSNAAE